MAEEKTWMESLLLEKMARNADEQQALIRKGIEFFDTFGKPSNSVKIVKAKLFNNYRKETEVGIVTPHCFGSIGNYEEGLTFGALVEDEEGNLLEVSADRLQLLR